MTLPLICSVLTSVTSRRAATAGHLAPARALPASLRTTTDGAIRSFVRDPAAPAFTWRGDPELAHAVSQARAILGQ